MFLHLSVIHSVHGGGRSLVPGPMFLPWVSLSRRVSLYKGSLSRGVSLSQAQTSSGDHRSGRYASYWNAVLLFSTIELQKGFFFYQSMLTSTSVLFVSISIPVADLHSKILEPPPPRGAQILSISCSFWEFLAKSYVGAPLGSSRPHLWEILDPPLSTSVCLVF